MKAIPRQHEEDPRALAAVIGAVLHEPRRRALRIAVESLEERQRSAQLWQRLACESEGGAQRLANQLHSPDLKQIADYIEHSPRGLVVTTIHAGDYLLGLLRLRQAVGHRRRIIVLRKKAASELEAAVFQKFRRDGLLEVIRHDDKRVISVVRALRSGHVVVALFDLPHSFGATRQVPFLGHEMHLVRGPVELAAAGNADLLAFFSFRDSRLSHQCFLPPIRPLDAERECIALARSASTWVRQYPGQWQHWFRLPEMLDPDLGGPT